MNVPYFVYSLLMVFHFLDPNAFQHNGYFLIGKVNFGMIFLEPSDFLYPIHLMAPLETLTLRQSPAWAEGMTCKPSTKPFHRKCGV